MTDGKFSDGNDNKEMRATYVRRAHFLAGPGLEPGTSRLWAWRADITPANPM